MHRIQPYVLPGLLLAVFAVAYYPALALFSAKWSASEDYTHAFFIVPAIAYMIWSKRQLFTDNPGSPVIGSILVVLSILFYLVSLQLQIPTLIFVATVVSIMSALVYFAGLRILKELAIPLLLLFMIIPIPNQLMSSLTATLQLKISEVSAIFIRLFSVPMFREGNIIQLPQMTFQVVDACSGVRSLISMTTLSVLVSYFTLTRLWTGALLFLFSIPVAILINLTRVVLLVVIFHYLNIDLSEGTAHTITGLVLFIFGLVLLFTFQRILESWEKRQKNTLSP